MQPPNLSHLFKVRAADKAFRQVVPRRGSAIRPLAPLNNTETEYMKERAYAMAGLEEYNPCWTGEMAQRPIPFVSRDPRPLRTKDVFAKHIRHVLNFLATDMKPAVQAINKISSLGYPVNTNPGDGVDKRAGSPTFGQKTKSSKFDIVLDLFRDMQAGDFSIYKDGYHTIGVRKQNEPPSKVRQFQFISSDGDIFEEEIAATERIINVPQLGAMIGSRTRTITRPPVVNLWLQCVDTVIHNAVKRHPLCDSNVYTRTEWPSDTYWATFDCKHYERYLGLCAIEYAHAIGGVYEEQLLQLIYYPFIVPSSDWKRFFEITPIYGEGVYPQFSSGLSPVAPLGKLTNICVQVEYFITRHKMDVRSAIATVLSGTSGGMRRWMFGDDNRVTGNKDEVEQYVNFMGEYFEIEREEVPRYLGTIFRADIGRWVLPADTYHLKLYQPERDYEWKDYPNLGLVARRDVFTEYGEPEIGSKYIPYENDLWNEVGHPFVEIVSAAIVEKQKAQRSGIMISRFAVTDKEYLMTEDEKIASGLFWHLKPESVATIFISLIGRELLEQVSFKHAPFTPVPAPRTTAGPFVQAGVPTTIDEDTEQELTYA